MFSWLDGFSGVPAYGEMGLSDVVTHLLNTSEALSRVCSSVVSMMYCGYSVARSVSTEGGMNPINRASLQKSHWPLLLFVNSWGEIESTN